MSTPQTLTLNSIDFDKGGSSTKSTHKFTMTFRNGRLLLSKGLNPKGRDLAEVLLLDPAIKQIFTEHEFVVSLTNKFQLSLTAVNNNVETTTLEAASEAVR